MRAFGWVAGLGFGAALGCAVLDAPEPVLGPKAPATKAASEHAPLAALCECATAQAESELGDSIDALERGAPAPVRPGFSGCANALTGLPSIPAPAPIMNDAGVGFAELDRGLRRCCRRWSFSIDDDAPMNVGLTSQAAFELRTSMTARLRPALRALRDAHLASRACHATALLVALDDALRDGQPEALDIVVVERAANAARRADGIAAAATGLALELRRIARSPNRPLDFERTLGTLRALRFDGVFASDTDDVQRVAERHARTLGASFDPTSPRDPLARGVLLPLWLAPRPTLAELCNANDLAQETAVRLGLQGLRERDLRRMMLAAPALYPADSTPRHAREALCALLASDDARAVRSAREMVPRYSDVQKLLAAAEKVRR